MNVLRGAEFPPRNLATKCKMPWSVDGAWVKAARVNVSFTGASIRAALGVDS